MNLRPSTPISLSLLLLLLPLLPLLACSAKDPVGLQYANVEPPPPLPEPKEQKPLTVDGELARADMLRDNGDLPEAVWHYVRGLQLDRVNPGPRQRLGYMQLSRDIERAEKIFERLVGEHPRLVSGHVGLGLAQIAVDKPESARSSFETALRLDPDSALSEMGLGMVDDRLGNHERARGHYVVAQELDPYRYVIPNNLGMSHLISGNYEEAADAFSEAIFLEPRDPALYNNLGITRAREGRYDAALESFRKVSGEADALNNVGFVCLTTGEFERAQEFLERSLMKGPSERETVIANLRAAEDAMAAR